MADYFINNIPDDGVVPWYLSSTLWIEAWWLSALGLRIFRDFNAPLDPPRPADTSAAMIAVNGLLLLAQQELTLSSANAIHYQNAAIKVSIRFCSIVKCVQLTSIVGRYWTITPNLSGSLNGNLYYRMGLSTILQLTIWLESSTVITTSLQPEISFSSQGLPIAEAVKAWVVWLCSNSNGLQ